MLKPFIDAADHAVQLRKAVNPIAKLAAAGRLNSEQEIELTRLEHSVNVTLEAISRVMATQLQSWPAQAKDEAARDQSLVEGNKVG